MDRRSCGASYPAESAHLVRSLLETYRRNEAQGNEPGDPETGSYRWPACKDFTIEEGKKQIGAYIQSWGLQPRWVHSLDFLGTTEEQYRTFHHYRARFSTTTSRQPIQGTASVYFAVDLSKVKPQSLPVQVHFVVESGRLVHTPGRTGFKDKWLEDVIENKTLLWRAVNL